MKFPIALQVYSVRDDFQKDPIQTLKRIRELGYEGVEFAGLYGTEVCKLRSALDELGLKAVSAHVPIDELLADPEGTIQQYVDLGCEFIAIPWVDEPRRPGHEGYAALLENIKELCERCKEKNVTLLYHNHDFEFVKIDGEYALDYMYRTIPQLGCELDVCWVHVGGASPVEYIKKYNTRGPVLHLKDYAGKKSEHMYGLIGTDNEAADEPETNTFQFRPVGYGIQDFYSILNAAEEVGVKWVVVEQDQPSMGRTPFECAELSINYLKTLL